MSALTRLIAALVVTSVAAAADQPDAWITLKAKVALMDAIGAEALDVDVDTTNGRVTLHGLLDTQSEQSAALDAVRAIEGVDTVRNLLAVVDDPEDVEMADRLLRSRLDRRLDADPRLDAIDIEIDSISDGVVLLRAEAEYYEDVVTMKRIAQRVPGVRRVVTSIDYTTEDGAPNYETRRYARDVDDEEMISLELDEDVEAELEDVTDATNQWMRDSWITTEVKLAMYGSEAIDGSDVLVDTNDRVVTLFGEVDSDTERREAIALAWTVEGVEDVIDSLRMEMLEETPVVSDEVIDAQVSKLLQQHAMTLPLDTLTWKVQDGVVHLDGNVDSQEDRYQAAALAHSVVGVGTVRNDVEVTESSDSKADTSPSDEG